MNNKAQLQIRLLYAHSNPAKQKELTKYLKPLPIEKIATNQSTKPQHIREILPDVMLNIQQRIEKAMVKV